MRIYGIKSGRNNMLRLLARSWMFNKNSNNNNNNKIKEKEKTFLQKQSFEEYNGADWICCAIFIIGAILIIFNS